MCHMNYMIGFIKSCNVLVLIWLNIINKMPNMFASYYYTHGEAQYSAKKG